ncbi:MFS transporter [Kitasatospora sp. NPDC058201]|uniref:MFS transporter n=1 Tax=Streptomycetaceae TaxID=2062 RepID=UPI002E77CE4E|nr:MFS transporter [Streptomyces sp. BE303]MED7951361.1 MFS transporter [Streptomyces sp. BE303]
MPEAAPPTPSRATPGTSPGPTPVHAQDPAQDPAPESPPTPRAPHGEHARHARPGLVLATVCLCQLMVTLDASIVNIALPAMSEALGFVDSALPWVVNAYALAFGGLLLLGGRIADLVGHRRAVLSGLVLFGIASVLGGFAQTPTQLVAARAGQGVAAAVLAPIGLTLIMVTFAEGPARARALGIWSMVTAGGSALGVLLGGVLTDLLDWRWVFFVNAPIVLVGVALAARSVPAFRPPRAGRPDVLGAVLGTGAMTALVYGLMETDRHPWGSARTLGTIAAAVLLGLAFLFWESRFAQAPIVRLGVLRARTAWVASTVVTLLGAAMLVGFYFCSLHLQNVLHYGPLAAGAAFLPFCAGTAAGSMIAGRLTARFGGRATLTGGLLLGGLGMLWFAGLGVDSGYLTAFVGPSLVASVGVGICMVSNTAMGTSGVDPREAGLVSGLLNAGRQCGGSIGLAVLSTLAVSATRRAAEDGETPLAALAAGYDRAFVVTAALLGVAALISVLFVPARKAASGPQPARPR